MKEQFCTGASALLEAEVQTIFKNREWVACEIFQELTATKDISGLKRLRASVGYKYFLADYKYFRSIYFERVATELP